MTEAAEVCRYSEVRILGTYDVNSLYVNWIARSPSTIYRKYIGELERHIFILSHRYTDELMCSRTTSIAASLKFLSRQCSYITVARGLAG